MEEKQVGPVSYMVKEPNVLYTILNTDRVLRSRKQEYNPSAQQNQYYVSLSRNMTAAAIRNESRWKYGIIIDGTKLSNRYNIEPVSYMGTTTIKSNIPIKTLTSYDNDTYYVTFLKFPTMRIGRTTFEKLKAVIEDMPEDMKQLKKLQHQIGGKRAVRGTKIKEKYNFNVPSGGVRISTKDFPELISQIQKDPGINEYEERIWLKGSDYFINVKNCITGIILPKTDKDSDNVDVQDCITFAENNSLDILWY
jgi:hypothetical protein